MSPTDCMSCIVAMAKTNEPQAGTHTDREGITHATKLYPGCRGSTLLFCTADNLRAYERIPP